MIPLARRRPAKGRDKRKRRLALADRRLGVRLPFEQSSCNRAIRRVQKEKPPTPEAWRRTDEVQGFGYRITSRRL